MEETFWASAATAAPVGISIDNLTLIWHLINAMRDEIFSRRIVGYSLDSIFF